MKRNILKKSIIFVAISFLFFGCTSSFDEVNTDPNNPKADIVPSTNILAYCLQLASGNIFSSYFDLNESCGFSGQIALWMYNNTGYYNFAPATNTTMWTGCYFVTSNLKAILEKEKEGSNMWAVATIFQCQMFSIMSDRWGNIPYSDALKLEEGSTKPLYDKQSTIYPDLLKRLKKAVEILDKSGDALGAGDVMLGGDITKWKKYGNSLRLRIAARIANIDATDARATFEEILGDPQKYPIVDSNDDNVFFLWNDEYPEPYAYIYQTHPNDFGISKLMVETLKSLDDPRLSVYAKPTVNWTNASETDRKTITKYEGYQNGLQAYANVAVYSGIGIRFMSTTSLTGFSPWLRSCETYFAIAYAASKGWNVGMTQEEAYNKGVTLSLIENNCSDNDIAAYLSSKAKYDGTQEQLFTQWWISVYKNGMEAWSLFRMSGYPKGNIIAPDSYYPGHNTPPMCYGYPDSERTLNADNCNAEAAAEIDYFWGKKMWWDTRTGLK